MADNRLDDISKESIKDLNVAEARGWVIDRMNQIESMINDKIIKFFEPKEKRVFSTILLNNSVISLGGKLKVLAGCKLLDKKTIEQIRELSSIRNAFAHIQFVDSVTIETDFENDKSIISEQYQTVEVMNSMGDLKWKKVHEHLSRFFELYLNIQKTLKESDSI